jgi:uncharacterized protein (TIGR00290 family)
MEKAALFWSGGKDSAFALYTVLQQQQYEIVTLVTTLNSRHERISMHGVRESMLDLQAAALQLPLLKMWVPDIPSNEVYEQVLLATYAGLKKAGITTIIFGDIFLEDLRQYREAQLQQAGLQAYFPLWQQPTPALANRFITTGFKTITCCISTAYVTKAQLGKLFDAAFLAALPPGTDPCGENGEFHTFCFDGPIFSQPVLFTTGEEKYVPLVVQTETTAKETGFWYIDLAPVFV